MLKTEDSFFELKRKKIILYGAASIGIIAKEFFESNGFEVIGFIDKRSEELRRFLEKPVWGIEDIILDTMKTEEYVIFVSVKNVFEHSKIANDLVLHGFYNLIYRPLAAINGVGNDKQKKLYSVYSLVEQKRFDEIDIVPKTKEFDRIEAHNAGFIQEDSNTTVCLVSLDLLHTDKKIKGVPWYDKPVMSQLPHIDFFRYVSGDQRYSYELYMNFCEEAACASKQIEITQSWKNNVLKNRASVYSHMSDSFELNYAFFYKNAPDVIWNENSGVFNLVSGKHRAAFFTAHKRKYIPLRMSNDDYKKFLNLDSVYELEAYYKNKGETEICYPIPHPFYYDYPCENREFYYNFLYWLIYYISVDLFSCVEELDFSSLSIYSRLFDGGFIERCLNKAGCYIDNEIDSSDKELFAILDRLLFSKLSNNIITRAEMKNKQYDYAFIDLRTQDMIISECKIIAKQCRKECFFIIYEGQKELYNLRDDNFCCRTVFSAILDGQRANVISLSTKSMC